MSRPFLALTWIAVSVLTARASNTVVTNFSPAAGRGAEAHPLMLADGITLYPSGSGVVATGFFSLPDGVLSAVSTKPEWAAALATFTQFGTTGKIGGSSALGNDGLYKLTVGLLNLPGSPFDGPQIYTVIGNAATLATSTQIVVYKAATTFAVDPDPPEARGELLGTPFPGTLLIGSLGTPGVYYSSGFLSGIPTSPVVATDIPEPTAVLLGFLALGVGCIRRRATVRVSGRPSA